MTNDECRKLPGVRKISAAARDRMLSLPREPLFLADWNQVVMIHYEVDAEELTESRALPDRALGGPNICERGGIYHAPDAAADRWEVCRVAIQADCHTRIPQRAHLCAAPRRARHLRFWRNGSRIDWPCRSDRGFSVCHIVSVASATTIPARTGSLPSSSGRLRRGLDTPARPLIKFRLQLGYKFLHIIHRNCFQLFLATFQTLRPWLPGRMAHGTLYSLLVAPAAASFAFGTSHGPRCRSAWKSSTRVCWKRTGHFFEMLNSSGGTSRQACRTSGWAGRTAFEEQWCQRRELNPRPKAYESSALPLSYSGSVGQNSAKPTL